MEAKIQYKNERNRVRSAKILEDILIQSVQSFLYKNYLHASEF